MAAISTETPSEDVQAVVAEDARRATAPEELDGDEDARRSALSARGWRIFLLMLALCTIVQTIVFLGLVATNIVPLRIGLLSVGLSVIAVLLSAKIVAADAARSRASDDAARRLPTSAHFVFGAIMLIWLIQIHFFGSVFTPLSILITLTALIGSWLFGPTAGWCYFGAGTAGWILTIVLEKYGLLPFLPGYQKSHQLFEQIFDDTMYVAFRLAVFVSVSAAIIQLLNHFQRNLQERNRELADLSKRLEILATTDALTGLMNRRTVMGHFAREMTRAKRQGKTLAVVMADLDDFKKVNDTHGHAAGDAVLQAAAAVFRGCLRPYDLLARIGGEEFLFIVANGGPDETRQWVERLRSSLAERSIDAPGGSTLRATASFGCALFDPERPRTLDDLLRAADEALYAAKRSGKNRCTFAA